VPRLQILNGKRQGSVFDLADGGELVIGHRATASVAIDDPWVSWDHARIYFQGRDCHIEDLGSTNGTYVNCVRVKHEELRHEDIIFLGKTHVLFLAPSTSDLDAFLVEDSVDDFGAGAISGLASEHGPFNSGSGSPPLVNLPVDPFAAAASGGGFSGGQDPFAAAASANDPFGGAARDPFAAAAASGVGQHDPFASGGVDPFSSGADYSDVQSAFVPTPPPFPAPGMPPGMGPGGTTHLKGDPRGDLALSAEPGSGLDPRLAPGPRSVSNPFSDDPISSGVLRVNQGGGFVPNSLSTPTHGTPVPPQGFDQAYAKTQAERSPFAETRGDESLSPLRPEPQRKPSRSLSLSQLDDDGEPELPAPSPREIADLLENSGRRKRAHMSGSDLGLSDELDQIPESEMRTREIDTNDVAAILAEHEGRSIGPAATPAPAAPQLGIESTHADILARVAAEQGDLGLAIFERARLQAENQRLRLAIQAVQQQNPQAVQAAAQAFRDQELIRLGQQVAELERQAAELRETLAAREAELNEVTEDMIDKEDRIDQLEGELRDLR
jgi:FHA domain-containing protein